MVNASRNDWIIKRNNWKEIKWADSRRIVFVKKRGKLINFCAVVVTRLPVRSDRRNHVTSPVLLSKRTSMVFQQFLFACTVGTERCELPWVRQLTILVGFSASFAILSLQRRNSDLALYNFCNAVKCSFTYLTTSGNNGPTKHKWNTATLSYHYSVKAVRDGCNKNSPFATRHIFSNWRENK